MCWPAVCKASLSTNGYSDGRQVVVPAVASLQSRATARGTRDEYRSSLQGRDQRKVLLKNHLHYYGD